MPRRVEVQFFSTFRPTVATFEGIDAVPAASDGPPAPVRVQRAAERLQQVAAEVAVHAGGFASSRASVPVLWSAAALGLSTTATTSEVRSTAEINVATSSFGPAQPAWSGGSTAQPTIAGTYTGTDEDTFTFTVTQVPILGLGSTRLAVTDQLGASVATVTIPSGDNATVRTVADGLTVAFDTGSFQLFDTFSVDVSAADVDLDPDAAMDGSGPSGPGFEAGTAVVDGGFELNGTTIAVAAADTVGDVLDRITASAAGVDASYDAASDTVVLRARSAGSAGTITVGSDTSGFLQAVKLDGAVVTAGIDADADRPLHDLTPFAAIPSGTLRVNGVAVAFDPTVDSLRTLLARITATADVDASLSGGDQLVLLQGRTKGSTMTLDDGGSGLLDAAGITQRSVRGPAFSGLSAHRRGELADALVEVRSELESLWSAALQVTGLRSAVAGIFHDLASADKAALQQLLGITTAPETLSFGARTRDELVSRLAALDASSVRSLKRNPGGDGVTAALLRVANEAKLRTRSS